MSDTEDVNRFLDTLVTHFLKSTTENRGNVLEQVEIGRCASTQSLTLSTSSSCLVIIQFYQQSFTMVMIDMKS